MEPTGKEKTRFRGTVAWKRHRLAMVKGAESRCELCGIKKTAKGLDVHHLDPGNYTDLNPDKFKVLCTDCHAYVERSALRLGGRDPFPRREVFLAWIGPFLPRVERTVDKLMSDISIRAEYNKALGSGMFFVLHPDLTGIWEEDREEWIRKTSP